MKEGAPFFLFSFPFSISPSPPPGLPAGSEALPAGSQPLPASSEALPAGFETLSFSVVTVVVPYPITTKLTLIETLTLMEIVRQKEPLTM